MSLPGKKINEKLHDVLYFLLKIRATMNEKEPTIDLQCKKLEQEIKFYCIKQLRF